MACFVPGPAAGVRHEVIIGPVVDLDVTGGWCGKAWLSQVRELAILHFALHELALSRAA